MAITHDRTTSVLAIINETNETRKRMNSGLVEMGSLVDDNESSQPLSVIVGNPPYQSDPNNNNVSSLYPHFMEVSKQLASLVSLVYPFKWTFYGAKEFKTNELHSRNYSYFYVHSGESDVFGLARIKGGINYFLWNIKERAINEKMMYRYDNKTSYRDSLLDGQSTFIDNNVYLQIINKVNTIDSLTASATKPYGPKTLFKMSDSKSWDKTGNLSIYLAGGVKKPISTSVTDNNTKDYKVFATASNGKHTNSLSRVIRIFVGYPNEICSSTYLKIGSYSTEQEAINTVRYLKTDFINFLMAILSPTQHSYRSVYALVPNVDFNTGEIIDRKGTFLDFNSPDTLDEQLYKIYSITDEQKNMIVTSIKPWKEKLLTGIQHNK